MPRYARNRRRERESPEPDLYALMPLCSLLHKITYVSPSLDRSVKIRVENLHYDLTEDDLKVSPVAHSLSSSTSSTAYFNKHPTDTIFRPTGSI